MKRILSTIAAVAMAVATMCFSLVVPLSQRAAAQTATATVTYSGKNSQDIPIFDSGLLFFTGCFDSNGNFFQDPSDPNVPNPSSCEPDIFPGTVWLHLQAGIRNTVVTAQTANVAVTPPDSIHQGDTANLATRLTAVDAPGKEATVTSTPYIAIDVAYDSVWANCPANLITSVQALAAVASGPKTGCLADDGDVLLHQPNMDLATFKLLEQDTTLPFSGTANVSQNNDSPAFDLAKLLKIDSVATAKLKLRLSTALSLLATLGYHGSRTLTGSSNPATPIASGPVSFPSPNLQNDIVNIPCSVPAGDTLSYKLSNNGWDGTGTANAHLSVILTAGLFGFERDFDLFDSPSVQLFNGDVHATGSDVTLPVGQVVADNSPPTIMTVAHAGTLMEGSDTQFSTAATDNCSADLSYQWSYSDGGVSYGATTHHTFADNGTYTGRLTVVDGAGNSSSKDFSVDIANANPSVMPPPDASAAWGVPIQFHADVYDPGTADQPTLRLRWDFGDATGAAGTDVSHTYAAPGDYPVGLTVTDKDGGVGTATMAARVTRRATSVAILGDRKATFDTTATYAASLADQLGNPLPGQPISFGTPGALAGVSATTGSNGVAQATQVVSSPAGTYGLNASFSGDSLYQPSSAGWPMVVTQKATKTTYTGPTSSSKSLVGVLSGGNRNVTLTATLADSDGKVLAGRTVVFVLGSQSASGVTDSNGVATASMRLTQPKGSYPLTATYSPAGNDTGRYLTSSDSTTFKLV